MIISAILIVLAFLIVMSGFIPIPLSPCGPGFGDIHKQVQIEYLQGEWHEALPEDIKLIRFKCSGFQDIDVQASLELNERSGRRLLAALESTYATSQHDKKFPDSHKSRHQFIELYDQVIEFELPAAGSLYGRDIALRWSINDPKIWQLEFHGYTW